jgi:hypothetical protein
LLRKFTILATTAAAVLSMASCADKLDAGKSCPLLCPEQALALIDTTIDAVIVDTTIVGLPPIGAEQYLMLATHGDTLDTRAIVRFDTLPQQFTDNAFDSTITHIDSAYLIVPIVAFDSTHKPTAPVTLEAYDVDTTGSDTSAAVLASLFRPDRFLGSRTLSPDSLIDSLHVPINTDTVLDRVNNGTHLRVGLRVVSSQSINIQIGTTTSGIPVTLYIKPALDSTATPVTVTPLSNTPTDEPFLAGPLADYTIIVNGDTPGSPALLAVGGVPSRRTYLRFDVPSRLVDSTTIVRASLLLTQSPNPRLGAHDSIPIYPVAILAQATVTDIGSALGFLGGAGGFGIDSLVVAPGDSGVKVFEIVGLVRTWHQQPITVSPRTLALVSAREGQLPDEVDFFSTRSAVGLRPRLRITYVPQTSYGVP